MNALNNIPQIVLRHIEVPGLQVLPSTIVLKANRTHGSLDDRSWRRVLATASPSTISRFLLVKFNTSMLL